MSYYLILVILSIVFSKNILIKYKGAKRGYLPIISKNPALQASLPLSIGHESMIFFDKWPYKNSQKKPFLASFGRSF